jgi:hypothetical protein
MDTNLPKDVLVDNSNTTNSKLQWWYYNSRYVILGILVFLVIMLIVYVYKMTRSCSRQLKYLTDIITDQQERLNQHSKLLFGHERHVVNDGESQPKLTLKDMQLSSLSDKFDQLFTLSNQSIPSDNQHECIYQEQISSTTTEPSETTDPQEDDDDEVATPSNVEEEIADEIQELHDSVVQQPSSSEHDTTE